MRNSQILLEDLQTESRIMFLPAVLKKCLHASTLPAQDVVSAGSMMAHGRRAAFLKSKPGAHAASKRKGAHAAGTGDLLPNQLYAIMASLKTIVSFQTQSVFCRGDFKVDSHVVRSP